MATLVDAVNYIGICKAGSAHGRRTGAWRWRWWGRSPTNKDSGSTWRSGTKTRMGGIVEQERRVPPCARGGAAHWNAQTKTNARECQWNNEVWKHSSWGQHEEGEVKRKSVLQKKWSRREQGSEESREVKRERKWRENELKREGKWKEKGSEESREMKRVGKWRD